MSETIDIKFKRPVQEELVEAPLHACEYLFPNTEILPAARCQFGRQLHPVQALVLQHSHLEWLSHHSSSHQKWPQVGLPPPQERKRSFSPGVLLLRNQQPLPSRPSQRYLFSLTLATYKDKEHILIICRSCQSASQNQEITWKQNDFQSLVQEKCIQPWLAK